MGVPEMVVHSGEKKYNSTMNAVKVTTGYSAAVVAVAVGLKVTW